MLLFLFFPLLVSFLVLSNLIFLNHDGLNPQICFVQIKNSREFRIKHMTRHQVGLAEPVLLLAIQKYQDISSSLVAGPQGMCCNGREVLEKHKLNPTV